MKNKVIYLLLLMLLIAVLPACSADTEKPLPHSFKGYELYSWQEGTEWHFTLITGTNRTKTLEEIISGESTVTDDGWVRIHAVGEEGIKAVLSRLPKGEDVFWGDGHWVNSTALAENPLTIGTKTLIKDLSDYAKECGFTLMVMGS
jgi:hypothetical protein